MKRRLLWKLLMLAPLLVLTFFMLRQWEHNQVYHPGRVMSYTGAELKRPFENIFFPSGDGLQLNGWFYPADTNSPRGRLVFVICHGNAGNISDRLELYRSLLDAGAAVFAFDYRGFGRSEGKPGEEGTYRDAQAAHRWLRDRGFAGKGIIVYGESLGGGIASELCLREETGGLVLQSTFTSIPDIGADLYPWLPVRWINSIKYDTLSKLPRLKIPVLIMHSREDGLIAFHHGEKNFAAANEPKQFCELRGDHNGLAWTQPEFKTGMETFLKRIEAAEKK